MVREGEYIMCLPAAAGLAISLVGTGISVLGQMQAQKSADKQARAQAMFQQQQALAEQLALNADAKHTIQNAGEIDKAVPKTREEGIRARLSYQRKMDKAKTDTTQSAAARGVNVFSESVEDEIGLIDAYGKQDLESIYQDYERQALGFSMQADDMRHRAKQQLKGAKQAGLNAGFYANSFVSSKNNMALAASLTSGAGNAFQSYSIATT